MAEAAVGAAIQVLLEQLLTLSQEQISLIRNFKNDLVKLKDSLDMVKAFLHDAETKQVTSEAVKIWLRDLEALAFEADNVLDEFNYQLLSKQVGPTTRNKTVMKKAQSFFSCSNNKIAYRHKLGRRIKGVNQKLESINQKAVGFGLQNIAVQASVCGSPSRETDPFAVDPIILGRENDVSIIVDKLITTTPSPAEQVLSVLPIVGMGGLGKTTLARKVFHHEKMISHFGDNRVWVYVSRKFDVCKILKNILTSFTKEKFELDTRAALLQKLQDHLRTKRYLLVLDDVWNEDREMWDGFDCWSIIKAKAFRVGDNPSEFEAIGNSIAEKCGDDRNPISKILKLSFDNLPSPSLKKCFAYCSIFPKGYKIEKEILIELWMAEGFLQTDRQRSNVNMETTSSLLQVVERDIYLNVTHCNMHDLVHDLACSLTDGICQSDCQSRYIGYKPSGDGLLSIPKGQERYVRTLFFNGKISDITFSDFESLHSLNLEGEDDNDVLPTSIRKLKHLRYLDISETSITFLPDSIGELYHLQTLRAEVCDLEKLPDSLSYLIILRHLHISLGDEKGRRISELGNLKNLKGKLEIRNLEKVRDKDESKMADLLGKPGIYELNLEWDESSEGGEANDESVLEGLQPHPNLKGLEICGFNGKRLPLWTSKLNNLMEIALINCRECEELPMLGHLPHLKSLRLDGFQNVKYIGSSFYGIDKCKKSGINNSYNGVYERDTIVVFRALERLVLRDMPNLIEWAQVDLPLPSEGDETQRLYDEVVVFPCLEELRIHEMESSLALENICGTKLSTLTSL
ncbi:putative disease resistance protein rga3 [Phtheirospermum japonicum]|uniref:Putative disease resistance protein rga3 n=1 Tax=Phtheirospermum japonicum TaxID=374723 RepID=A0A830BE34_9LAMI|nr:putative disease resistance protein rga3 [Phtheirospermum japonicum]